MNLSRHYDIYHNYQSIEHSFQQNRYNIQYNQNEHSDKQ